MSSVIELVRKGYFSCGHRYFNPNWSVDKNRDEFGACYSEHGHGHNYEIHVHVKGPCDPESGMVMNLRDIDKPLKDLEFELDHKFLNSDVPYFKEHIPTTENIASYCFHRLKNNLRLLNKVVLYENQDLWVECYE